MIGPQFYHLQIATWTNCGKIVKIVVVSDLLSTNKRRRESNSPSTMEIIGNTTSHVNFLKIKIFLSTGGSTCKPRWSQDHLDLQKMAYIHLPPKKKNYMLN